MWQGCCWAVGKDWAFLPSAKSRKLLFIVSLWLFWAVVVLAVKVVRFHWGLCSTDVFQNHLEGVCYSSGELRYSILLDYFALVIILHLGHKRQTWSSGWKEDPQHHPTHIPLGGMNRNEVLHSKWSKFPYGGLTSSWSPTDFSWKFLRKTSCRQLLKLSSLTASYKIVCDRWGTCPFCLYHSALLQLLSLAKSVFCSMS